MGVGVGGYRQYETQCSCPELSHSDEVAIDDDGEGEGGGLDTGGGTAEPETRRSNT